MVKHTIFKAYFGTDIKGKATVTRQAFEKFLKGHVNSRFEGYSVTDSLGYWDGTSEKSFILEVIVMGNETRAALTGHQLTRISKTYCKDFDQDCVIVTKQDIDAVFIGA